MELVQSSLLFALPTVGLALTWRWLRRDIARLQSELATSRQQHEEALRQQQGNRELFRTLFEAAPECVKLTDADGEVQRINPAGLALLETTHRSHIVGKSVYSVIADEHHADYRQLTADVFAGQSRTMEFELTTFRGRRRWLETHAVPLRDAKGDIVSMLAVTRDINERRLMTQQLTEQRNRLHTIIESEPECVKLQDRDGVIMEMNPAGLSLLNAEDPDQVIGRTVYEFLDDEYREAYRQLTEDVFNGSRRSLEFEINTIEGQRRWLDTHAAPLKDADGQVIALLAITRDIDERKQNEEKLRRQHDELAHVCRLSTLGELASGLAHELNQPLCALSSYAETAMYLSQQHNLGERDSVGPILSKIVTETERANDIIQRLRDFVRKRTPSAQANDVIELIDDVVALIEPERRRRRVAIERTIDAHLPEVWVDRVQAEQVLLNLFHNALHATPPTDEKRRHLSVSITSDSDRVRVALRDFGDGIPAELRQQLFTPFFTTKEQGIGMGLALSRSIAETYGGQLLYEPADPGSRFTLILPAFGRRQ